MMSKIQPALRSERRPFYFAESDVDHGAGGHIRQFVPQFILQYRETRVACAVARVYPADIHRTERMCKFPDVILRHSQRLYSAGAHDVESAEPDEVCAAAR